MTQRIFSRCWSELEKRAPGYRAVVLMMTMRLRLGLPSKKMADTTQDLTTAAIIWCGKSIEIMAVAHEQNSESVPLPSGAS